MKTKTCKFCKGKNRSESSEFCSFNCYQKWRYHNLPEEKKKIIKRNIEIKRKRYKKDEEYRKRTLEYNHKWRNKKLKKNGRLSKNITNKQ